MVSCYIISYHAVMLTINHNGPAIWGGCVTRRSIRAVPILGISQKAVTVQGGYGALFAAQVQVLLSITRVAVQTISKPKIYHGAGVSLQADARVQVHRTLRICLGCRSKSKKCDKQLTHIVRVRFRGNFKTVSLAENCLVLFCLKRLRVGLAGSFAAFG